MINKAIVVAGGNVEGLKNLIDEKAENQTIIGVDGGALALLEAGIIPQLAIGDFDSVSERSLEKLEEVIPQVIKLPTDKDLTDTEAALLYISENLTVNTIEMYGLFGGRVDHLISNLWLVFQPRYQALIDKIVMRAEKNSISFYKPGTYTVKKEKDKKYLSFIGMTPLTEVTLKNTKYPLDKVDYQMPIALVSNEFIADDMQFSFSSGLVAVIQSRD